MTRAARFLALAPGDRRVFLEAWAAGLPIRLALRVLGFRRCRAALGMLPARNVPAAAGSTIGDAARVARLARSAARHGALGRHCLTEALTLWWLLRRRGIDSEIRIGVRKEGGSLDAHAWVEWGGLALDEQPEVERTFAPLVRPAAG